jgi:hypothetical protein
VALVLWLWRLGLYRHVPHSPGTIDPTRRWTRIAFGFLLVSAVIQAGLYIAETNSGEPAPSTQVSAARHALAQGFLLPLMVAMAVRMLPIISADVLKHQRLLEGVMSALFLGALIRVGAELLGGYGPVAGPMVALGGLLSGVAFAVFALALWRSLDRLVSVR